MSDDILPLLKAHEYFRGIGEDTLPEVVRHAQVTHYPAGTVVHEANVLLTTSRFLTGGGTVWHGTGIVYTYPGRPG